VFFFSSRRRHTRFSRDWSSDVCSSDLAAAAKEGKLKSEVGAWGIAKKVGTFVIVAVAHLVDTALGDAHLFRDAAIFFFLANELRSEERRVGKGCICRWTQDR